MTDYLALGKANLFLKSTDREEEKKNTPHKMKDDIQLLLRAPPHEQTSLRALFGAANRQAASLRTGSIASDAVSHAHGPFLVLAH